MKTITVACIVALALVLSGCMLDGPGVEAYYQIRVANDSGIAIDVSIGEHAFTVVPAGTESMPVGGIFWSYRGDDTDTMAVLISESGFPMLQRGTVTVNGGLSYTIRVFYDAYSAEHRFTVEVE